MTRRSTVLPAFVASCPLLDLHHRKKDKTRQRKEPKGVLTTPHHTHSHIHRATNHIGGMSFRRWKCPPVPRSYNPAHCWNFFFLLCVAMCLCVCLMYISPNDVTCRRKKKMKKFFCSLPVNQFFRCCCFLCIRFFFLIYLFAHTSPFVRPVFVITVNLVIIDLVSTTPRLILKGEKFSPCASRFPLSSFFPSSFCSHFG